MSTPVARERVTTLAAVAIVSLIAAVVSYAHMQQLADSAGESWRSYLLPLSVDGLVVAASMVLLGRRRAGEPGGALAWSALAGGVLASVAANMADAHAGLTALLTAGWPAVAFAVALELLQQQRQTGSPALVSQPTEPEVQEPADTQQPALTAVPPLPAGPAPSHPKSKRDRPDVSGLSRDEICEQHGVSRATAYRWLQESQEAMA